MRRDSALISKHKQTNAQICTSTHTHARGYLCICMSVEAQPWQKTTLWKTSAYNNNKLCVKKNVYLQKYNNKRRAN